MNTALLIVVMSFLSLSGGAFLGGGIALAATRLVGSVRSRSSSRLLHVQGRESVAP
ncbi:MAG: hypothetical protein WBG86_07555 [Polyangiales bacterium]